MLEPFHLYCKTSGRLPSRLDDCITFEKPLPVHPLQTPPSRPSSKKRGGNPAMLTFRTQSRLPTNLTKNFNSIFTNYLTDTFGCLFFFFFLQRKKLEEDEVEVEKNRRKFQWGSSVHLATSSSYKRVVPFFNCLLLDSLL